MNAQANAARDLALEIRDRNAARSMRELLSADRVALARGRGDTDLPLIAALSNPSLHANALMRGVLKYDSKVVRAIMRRLLIALHSCDIRENASIGPGLALIHPFGIAIGDAAIGSNVTLMHNVTIGHTNAGVPTIDDDVKIFAGSTILGPVTIGRGATIGAGTYVDKDVAPGATVVGARPIVEPGTPQ
jgi:serine acetyltransferase